METSRIVPKWRVKFNPDNLDKGEFLMGSEPFLSQHPELDELIELSPGTKVELTQVSYVLDQVTTSLLRKVGKSTPELLGLPRFNKYSGYFLGIEPHPSYFRIYLQSGLDNHFLTCHWLGHKKDPNHFLMKNSEDSSAPEYLSTQVSKKEREKMLQAHFIEDVVRVREYFPAPKAVDPTELAILFDQEIPLSIHHPLVHDEYPGVVYEDKPLLTQLEQLERTLLKRGGLYHW